MSANGNRFSAMQGCVVNLVQDVPSAFNGLILQFHTNNATATNNKQKTRAVMKMNRHDELAHKNYIGMHQEVSDKY